MPDQNQLSFRLEFEILHEDIMRRFLCKAGPRRNVSRYRGTKVAALWRYGCAFRDQFSGASAHISAVRPNGQNSGPGSITVITRYDPRGRLLRLLYRAMEDCLIGVSPTEVFPDDHSRELLRGPVDDEQESDLRKRPWFENILMQEPLSVEEDVQLREAEQESLKYRR
ncbi:MAG: hypothetical protein ACAI35_02700 [Candidatus Methylacidiphilales bacterium]|nr:hypothetical protein [Candidatus Methylacidiphilales bacterium]